MITTAPAAYYLLTLINDTHLTLSVLELCSPTSLCPLCIIVLPVAVLIITDSYTSTSGGQSKNGWLVDLAGLAN